MTSKSRIVVFIPFCDSLTVVSVLGNTSCSPVTTIHTHDVKTTITIVFIPFCDALIVTSEFGNELCSLAVSLCSPVYK